MANKPDVETLFEFVPLTPNHYSVAVPVRLGASTDWLDYLVVQPSDPLKNIGDLLSFCRQLRGVSHMLILAAAALPKIRTQGSHPTWRFVDDPNEFRPGEPLLYIRQLDDHGFSQANKGNKDHEIVYARDSFSAKCNISDCHDLLVALAETHLRSIGPAD